MFKNSDLHSGCKNISLTSTRMEKSEKVEPDPLSAKDTSSFAYQTIKDRLPIILSKVADTVYRKKNDVSETYGEKGAEELKSIVGHVSKLRNEVQTNKLVIPLEDNRSDTLVWNEYLEAESKVSQPKWFESPWLYVECYMYRRIQEAVEKCEVLKDLDVFQDQKRKSFIDSQYAIGELMMFLLDVMEKLKTANDEQVTKYFNQFLQTALWGNKCDLSISAAQENAQKVSILDQLGHLRSNILIDNSAQVLQCLQGTTDKDKYSPRRVDIVLDNAGFELITDLCLAEFILAANLATTVVLHGKAMPWFVSDVTAQDFQWTLDSLCCINHIAMSHFGNLWKGRLKEGSWKLDFHDFWTMPFDYRSMSNYAPDLYRYFSDSCLVFFKGDLNYRKLVADRKWNPTVTFEMSLQGFHPAPICSLRAIKADVVVGLKEGQVDTIQNQDKKWMVNGNWAIISFCGKFLK